MRHSPIEADRNGTLEEDHGMSSRLPAPVVAIGGLLTVKRLAFWYQPLLEADETTDLPPDKRFIAPPDQGIGDPNELLKRVIDLAEKAHDRLDRRKLHIVGHSWGGLMGMMLGLERPDLIDEVSSLGGAQDGYSVETLATLALRHGLGNPEEAKHLRHDSPFLQEQRERRATEWQPNIPVNLVATPLDQLIIPPRGFNVQLPPGQTPEKRILTGPAVLGVMNWAIRRGLRLPDDVQPLRTRRPTEHLALPRDPAVINYIYRKSEAGEVRPSDLQQPSQASETLLAA